jgi:hypothetical protein
MGELRALRERPQLLDCPFPIRIGEGDRAHQLHFALEPRHDAASSAEDLERAELVDRIADRLVPAGDHGHVFT